jgi:palmitoyltransferase
MGRPGYITVPILSVLAAIGYVYYTTVFLAIPAWLGLSTAAGLANATVFTALAAACVATYAVAVSRDPGRVPASFVPDVEDAGSPIHEIKRKVLYSRPMPPSVWSMDHTRSRGRSRRVLRSLDLRSAMVVICV